MPRALAIANRTSGYTLTEVVLASVIMTVVAGGSLMAFTSAAKIQKATDGPSAAEANACAQDWLERLRNRVATDDPAFSPPATPGSLVQAAPPPDSWASWQSTLSTCKASYKRKFYAIPANCVGVNDCYAVVVKVCWNDPLNCP